MRKNKKLPVTMAVRPVPSIPSVTCSAVEERENPDGPFLSNHHISGAFFVNEFNP